jgi:hypothetical protein
MLTLVSPVVQECDGLLVSWRLHVLETLPVRGIQLVKNVVCVHAKRPGSRL